MCVCVCCYCCFRWRYILAFILTFAMIFSSTQINQFKFNLSEFSYATVTSCTSTVAYFHEQMSRCCWLWSAHEINTVTFPQRQVDGTELIRSWADPPVQLDECSLYNLSSLHLRYSLFHTMLLFPLCSHTLIIWLYIDHWNLVIKIKLIQYFKFMYVRLLTVTCTKVRYSYGTKVRRCV